MANRRFLPPLGALEVDVVDLFAKLTIGTSGSISASGGSWSGKGIASVTKESAAGQYTIVLSDNYNTFLYGGVTLMDDADSSPATVAVETRFISETVGTTKAIVIQGYNSDDGAVDDYASGAVLYVHLKLRNSSVS
jgi:hypothetical protein